MTDIVIKSISLAGFVVSSVPWQIIAGIIPPMSDTPIESDGGGGASLLLVDIEYIPITIDVQPKDGIILPITDPSMRSARAVSVRLVPAKNDASLPEFVTPYHFQQEFLGTNGSHSALLKVDYKIVVVNNSQFPYAFGVQHLASGYGSLELDLLTETGKILTVKRKTPSYLSDLPESNVLKPDRQWEYPVSLDRRLWDFPEGFPTNKIVKIRPRFAYGAYMVGGKFLRTQDEIRKRRRRERSLYDREGELVGEWIDYGNGNGRQK